MKVLDYSQLILQELSATFDAVCDTEIEVIVNAINKAKRIFVAGAGRSRLMVKSFAMRLMQLGFTSYVVGETTTPAIGVDDILLIASGSGETGTLKVIASKALENKAKLALLSIYPKSSIGELADFIVEIPATTPKKTENHQISSVQIGASLFEQSVLLICDAIVLKLNEANNTTNKNETLMRLHANLE